MGRTIIPDVIQEQDIARLPGDKTIREAARYMIDHRVGSVLVMDGDSLKGIFTERDALRIFVATRRNPDQTLLADVMTEHLEILSPGDSPEDAEKRMVDGNFRHMPVVDADGKVLGVVSQRDLLHGEDAA